MNAEKSVDELSEGIILLDEIIVPDYFMKSKPNEHKLARRRKRFAVDGYLNIIVNKQTKKLVKGYTYYLIAKEFGMVKVPCSFSKYGTAENYHLWISRKDRLKIYKRDNYECYICHDKVLADVDPRKNINAATLDHVIPTTAGGLTTFNNLKCCCTYCNTQKGSKAYTVKLAEKIKRMKQNRKINSPNI